MQLLEYMFILKRHSKQSTNTGGQSSEQVDSQWLPSWQMAERDLKVKTRKLPSRTPSNSLGEKEQLTMDLFMVIQLDQL